MALKGFEPRVQFEVGIKLVMFAGGGKRDQPAHKAHIILYQGFSLPTI